MHGIPNPWKCGGVCVWVGSFSMSLGIECRPAVFYHHMIEYHELSSHHTHLDNRLARRGGERRRQRRGGEKTGDEGRRQEGRGGDRGEEEKTREEGRRQEGRGEDRGDEKTKERR